MEKFIKIIGKEYQAVRGKGNIKAVGKNKTSEKGSNIIFPMLLRPGCWEEYQVVKRERGN